MHKHFVVRICTTQLGDGLKGLREWSRFSALLRGKGLWEWSRLPASPPGGEGLWEWSRLPASPPGGEGLWGWSRLSASLRGKGLREWSRFSASLRGKGLRKWRKLGHLLSAHRDSSDVGEMVWAMLRAMLSRRDKDGDGS
jgi:hypothetical protein